MDSETLYFGYGSNLDRADWVRWCTKKGYEVPDLVPVETAWLPGYSLRFHYHSTGRKGGAADVVPDEAGTVVPGMLFSLSKEAWALVDEKEGRPRFYERCPVHVLTASGQLVEAVTYVVVPEKKQPHLVAPTPAYEAIVRQGLENYNLPIEHLKKAIESFESKSTLDHVFVYGTLMKGEQRWPQLRSWSSHAQRGTVSGALYHLGAYPGMRLDEKGTVHGELHRCDDMASALPVFDQIEGCDEVDPLAGLYLRLPVPVEVEGGTVWAWTYVINQLPPHAKRIEDGHWAA